MCMFLKLVRQYLWYCAVNAVSVMHMFLCRVMGSSHVAKSLSTSFQSGFMDVRIV